MKRYRIRKVDPRVYRVRHQYYELVGEIFDYFHRTKMYIFEDGKTNAENRVEIRTEILNEPGFSTDYIFTFRDLRDTMVFDIGFGEYIVQEYDKYG